VISFRFHLISLVAVFLALGVGVLTGTTVINRGVVSRLESQTDALSGDLDALREQFDQRQREAEVWNEFGEQAISPILSGRLTQQQVVLVTQDGTSEESIAGVRRALEEAGGQIVASLTIGPKMALPTDADREGLAAILGADPSEEPEVLAAEAAHLVAERLAEGPTDSDTLELLLDADYLVIQGPRLTDTGLRALGGPGQAVVAMAGGPAPSALDPARFLVPLVTDLATAGMPVVAAEPVEGGDLEPPFVTALRGESAISSLISTQDNVDQLPGQFGLALALEDLLQGQTGHYGVKDGATRALPDLT
jgi:copper transport outer membrane protein MctB